MADTRETLASFYERYRTQLYACALAVTRCPDLAEDAVHNAFSRLLKMQADSAAENLKAYIFQSVRNAGVDLLRRRGPSTLDINDVEIFDHQSGPDTEAMRGEFQDRVTRGLEQLKSDERETIMQHLYAELTFREIAEIQELPISTVTSRYQRGLEKLRVILEEE